MEVSSSYFYLQVTEDFKKECKEAILFKLENKEIKIWTGYIWKEDRSIDKRWSKKNYQKGNIKLYKVSDKSGIAYRNMIWFYGSKKDIIEKELEAISLFINQENDAYTYLMNKANQHKSQIEFLKNVRSRF